VSRTYICVKYGVKIFPKYEGFLPIEFKWVRTDRELVYVGAQMRSFLALELNHVYPNIFMYLICVALLLSCVTYVHLCHYGVKIFHI
jgi:hypothetical protein